MRTLLALLVAGVLAVVGYGLWERYGKPEDAAEARARRGPAAVEVAPVRRGAITLRRTFSGNLEAGAAFTVAPKVGGRLTYIAADIGDPIESGQVVARIDDAELVQAVAQANAEVAVAEANHTDSVSAHELAERVLRRVESLSTDGITSESELDTARSEERARRSRVAVTAAQIERAKAALAAATIQHGYAEVLADWQRKAESVEAPVADGPLAEPAEEPARWVAERYVDEGTIVEPGSPILEVVELDPIVAVVNVPERDFSKLSVGLPAVLTTDAYPGVPFEGRIARLAPVFSRSTRQVRVELSVPNGDLLLKPGMFVRATLELEEVDDALIVPFAALTKRNERAGVFVVDETGARVHWRPLEVGIREGDDVQVAGEGVSGLVVTLGQEFCDDGSPVVVTER